MIVTVAGFLPFESGKTRLAARLVRVLRERGVDVLPYKPIGAHNLWEQHFSVEYSLEHRVLVGGDAIRLARAAGVKPEEVQPVDLLLAPPDVARFLQRPRDYLNAASNTFTQAVLVRIDTCRGWRGHLLVEDRLEALPPSLRRVAEELSERLEPSPVRIDQARFADMLASGQLLLAADSCAATAASKTRLLILESFNDVLIPIPKAIDSRLFIVAAPGRAVVYSGEAVVRAVEVLSGIKPGQVRSHEVLGLVKPLAVVDVDYAYSDDQLGEDIERLADMVLRLLGEA